MDLAAVVLGVCAGDRVARHGHERHVARIDEGGGEHGQGGLRADAVIDLVDGIERHAELALHEPRGGLFEGGDAVVGVAAVFGLVDLGGHDAADARGGHLVVLADAEVDQPPLGVFGQRLAFGPLDLLELVDLAAFAVAGAADAVGEKLLEIGIAHGWLGPLFASCFSMSAKLKTLVGMASFRSRWASAIRSRPEMRNSPMPPKRHDHQSVR